MGIFSDDDVNDAEKLVGEEAGRIQFLRGFENGWKEVKRQKFEGGRSQEEIKDMAHFMGLSIEYFLSELKQYKADYLEKNPLQFGFRLGHIVATLRFHPPIILRLKPDEIVQLINALKESYPKYYNFLVARFQKWNKKVRTQLKILEPPQIGNYKYLIKQL